MIKKVRCFLSHSQAFDTFLCEKFRIKEVVNVDRDGFQ